MTFATSLVNPPTHSVAVATAAYLSACACFILALKWLSAPATARRGNLAGQIGMLAAIVGALLQHNVIHYHWIVLGFAIGSLIGVPMAVFMPMTAVPQRTALSHAFGALAAAMVGTAHYYLYKLPEGLPPHPVEMGILCLEVLLGALTFTGSLMAFGKLQDLLPTRPMVYRGQIIVNLSTLAGALICGVLLTINPQ